MGDEGELPLQFRILGPLEVVRGDQRLAFRGSRERAVLALLVLHANRTLSAERLAEDLWSGDPPEGAIHSLRVYVSRLRQALGAAGEAVVTRPSAYELQVDPGTIDALRFEELVARGRDEAKAGDHSGAAATLRAALALWRGPALADVADAPFAQAQAGRLEEARLCALEDRIEADLACGRHGEVTAELEVLTRDHPFRERLWSLRMVALYRSGRQAEALRAYQELRSTLGDQLGIEPSSALQQLEGAVLRHDPALDWHPPGERVATAPGRLPQPLVRKERLPLVGREVELSRLDQLWQATRSGQRQLVLVAGEPGIGKSRLAAEFARTAHGGGALVVFGRCDEGMGVPYQPFVEALSRYLRQTSRPILGRLAGELVRLDPEVGERVHGLSPPLRSDSETERYRLFDAAAAWLGAMSETAPVLFVIEDLHWATKPTLLLLSHLLRSDEDLRLLLLVTFRDTPLDMSPDLADLVAELLRQSGVERVRLTGLDEPGVGALMEAQAGHDLDHDGRALARIVHGETAGNPFYVREMLSLLAEKGDIVRRDGRWVPGLPLAQLDVPDSVRDVVERRLTRLPDQTSEMLAVAAVLGERFDLAVLAKASGDSETSVVETLRPAVSARLVKETDAGRYQFIHALVRSALEDALGPTRRLQLHRAAGSAIEAVHAGHLDDHLPALAHHWARASAPAADTTRAVEYATRAGDRALAQLAHDEAVGYYRQALELLAAANTDLDLELLIALGEAQRRAGDAGHRETLLEAARRAQLRGNADALARAALANNRGTYSAAGYVDGKRVAVLEAALEAIGSDDNAERARLLSVLAAELGFAPDHAYRQHLSNEAMAMARRVGDLATLGDVLARRWAVMPPTAPVDRQLELDELAHVAGQLGDPVLSFWAATWGSCNAGVRGDGEALRTSLSQAAELAGALGQPYYSWLVGQAQSAASCIAGRLAEAEAKAVETLELAQTGGIPDAFQIYHANLFWIRYEQDSLEESGELLQRAAARSRHNPLRPAALAFALTTLDRADDARPVIDRLAAADFATLPGNFTWLYGLCMVAEACARLDDPDRAAVLHTRLSAHGGLVAFAGCAAAGAVDHYLGMLAATLGRHDLADGHFAAAERIHADFPAPTWLAHTRVEWARMLLSRGKHGDAERARGLLRQALATARQLGLANVERQAAVLLQ